MSAPPKYNSNNQGSQRFAGGSYAPPLGPPNHKNQYAPPTGPPPSHGDQYAPPPGPPPSHAAHQQQYAPPAEPSPSKPSKPLESWEIAVPDTSLLPPPPSFFSGWDRSPANNSDEASSNAGENWCAQHPLVKHMPLDMTSWQALQAHNIRLVAPEGWEVRHGGRGMCKWGDQPGVWHVSTQPRSRDSCLVAYPPVYSVENHFPLAGASPRMTYYEVAFSDDRSFKSEVSVSIGFSALPYPTFRQPGWHRGSLAVHGDDGHKYINDTWGGKEFTQPFEKGLTYGIGILFQSSTKGNIDGEVFLTKQGVRIDAWDLNEPIDMNQDRPVTGLQGDHDLTATIGTFDQTEFKAFFHPKQWMYAEARKAYGLH